VTAAPTFPADENGDVLRMLVAGGDDLSSPRNIEFEHIFQSKEAAVAFLAGVTTPAQSAELSWNEEESAWNVQVKVYMIPNHAEISRIEAGLDAIARNHGGRADGWGCWGGR
jgi:regulator of ribonuclease activity B